jgi:glycosyltransferase involved in cell wall biosynthesis
LRNGCATNAEGLFEETWLVNRCDVVIVNFNAGGFLKDAIESVLQSTSVAHVYVVDNASTDGSMDLLPRDCDARLSVIHNTANIGFAAACNLGLMQAASENLLLLNPDCYVVEGAVERLITALRSADRVGMVGPLLLNADGTEQAGGRRKLPTPIACPGLGCGGRRGCAGCFPSDSQISRCTAIRFRRSRSRSRQFRAPA